MINSHIQMLRQVMINYTDENGQLYFHDFATGDIHRGHSKTMYTEKGVFLRLIDDISVSTYVVWKKDSTKKNLLSKY